VPFFGLVHWLLGDVFLKRSFEQDKVRTGACALLHARGQSGAPLHTGYFVPVMRVRWWRRLSDSACCAGDADGVHTHIH
jgi:hypothetical protein